MSLVDYGSDSDSEQPQAAAPATLSAPNLAADPTRSGSNEAQDDDEDGEYNPQDAFGLSRITEQERSAAGSLAGASAGAVTAKAPSGSSAPQVIAAVRSPRLALGTDSLAPGD